VRGRILNIVLIGMLALLAPGMMGGCADDLSDLLRGVSNDLNDLADDIDDNHNDDSWWDDLWDDDD